MSNKSDYRKRASLVLHIEPLTLLQANAVILKWHRHHGKKVGHRFSIGVFDDIGLCHGAAIVDRPASTGVPQYHVAEVSRLVTDGTYNACSILYQACARAAKAMGFWTIQTFILDTEPGTSLNASGWTQQHTTLKGGSWGEGKGRNRKDRVLHPQLKVLWSRELNPKREINPDVFVARDWSQEKRANIARHS